MDVLEPDGGLEDVDVELGALSVVFLLVPHL